MLIAQITDLHVGFEPGKPEEFNMHRLNAVVRRIVEAPTRPDFLVMTGDLADRGDRESYDRLAETVAICPFPVWPMAGNHDLRQPLLGAFPDTPCPDGFIQYAIEGKDARMIVVDTLEPGRHGGAFCETRAAWLTAELARQPDTPTIIAMHHPPFESGISWLDGSANDPWMKRFVQAIAGHGQVQAILSGHLHRNIHTVWNGLSLNVCAATAPIVALDLRPIDPVAPDNRAMITDEAPGYALHYWDGERLVSHFEAVEDHQVLARFDDSFEAMVKLLDAERRQVG